MVENFFRAVLVFFHVFFLFLYMCIFKPQKQTKQKPNTLKCNVTKLYQESIWKLLFLYTIFPSPSCLLFSSSFPSKPFCCFALRPNSLYFELFGFHSNFSNRSDPEALPYKRIEWQITYIQIFHSSSNSAREHVSLPNENDKICGLYGLQFCI